MSDKRRKKQQKRAKRKGKVLVKKAAARERMRQDEELVDEAVEALDVILPLVDEGAPLAAWVVPEALLVEAVTASGSIVGAAQRRVVRVLCEDGWLAAAREALERCSAERAAELASDPHRVDPDTLAHEEARFWLAPELTTLVTADQNALLSILYAHAANGAIMRGALPTTLLADPDVTRVDLRREHESRRRARGFERAIDGPLPDAAIDLILPAGAPWIEEVKALSNDYAARGARIARAVREASEAGALAPLAGRLRQLAEETCAAGKHVIGFDLARIAECLLDDTIVSDPDGAEEPRSWEVLGALYVNWLVKRGAEVTAEAMGRHFQSLRAESAPPGGHFDGDEED